MLLRVDRPRPAVVLLRTAVVRLVLLEEHAQVLVGVRILRVDCARPADVLLRTVVVLLVVVEEHTQVAVVGVGVLRATSEAFVVQRLLGGQQRLRLAESL